MRCVEKYTGQSFKRAFLLLYCSMGLQDAQVMEVIQMNDFIAYANYCATFLDCGPSKLARLTSVQGYVEHVHNIAGKSDDLNGANALKR